MNVIRCDLNAAQFEEKEEEEDLWKRKPILLCVMISKLRPAQTDRGKVLVVFRG